MEYIHKIPRQTTSQTTGSFELKQNIFIEYPYLVAMCLEKYVYDSSHSRWSYTEPQENIFEKMYNGIEQRYVFNEFDLKIIEECVDHMIQIGEKVGFKPSTIDRAPLRNKYFFGEGYTYGSQMTQKGPGMERLYPKKQIEPIPLWIQELVIKPIVQNNIVPENFINSVVINDYKPGGCIVSHIDPPHIFDRPIVSLSLMSDGALSFGCKFFFKPIRVSQPVFNLALPRGVLTILSGYAADKITHCIRPEDTTSRRAVIVLRRVLPDAPRLPDLETPLKSFRLEKRYDKIYKKYYPKNFKRKNYTFKKTFFPDNSVYNTRPYCFD